MNVLWGSLLTLGVAAAAIAAMLLVRRRAPEGGYFADGDRAAGVFGVLATGFSVLLGFIVFLAFTSYDESRSGAETEALMVAQQVETAQFFPASASRRAHRRARLLRQIGRRRGVGPDAGGHARRRDQPVGGRALRDGEEGRAADRVGAVGLRQVARADLDAREPPGRTGSTAPSA